MDQLLPTIVIPINAMNIRQGCTIPAARLKICKWRCRTTWRVQTYKVVLSESRFCEAAQEGRNDLKKKERALLKIELKKKDKIAEAQRKLLEAEITSPQARITEPEGIVGLL